MHEQPRTISNGDVKNDLRRMEFKGIIVQAMGVKYSMDCSLFDKKIILGSIILQTILIIFRGGAIEYLLFLGNGC